MNVSMKPRITIEGDWTKMSEELINNSQFRPVVFGYTAEHAEYQEYGTGPHRGRSSYYIGREGIKALDEWARIKVGISDPAERKSFVHAVARKIGKEGMKPRPFFRPAIEITLKELQSRINKGESLHDIGDAIIELSNRVINAYGMPYKGDLLDSSFVDYLDNVTVPDRPNWKELGEIANEGWNKE